MTDHRTLRRLPSEGRCWTCGCVRARHPVTYCTWCGPQRCRAYRDLWFYTYLVIVVAMLVILLLVGVQVYRE